MRKGVICCVLFLASATARAGIVTNAGIIDTGSLNEALTAQMGVQSVAVHTYSRTIPGYIDPINDDYAIDLVIDGKYKASCVLKSSKTTPNFLGVTQMQVPVLVGKHYVTVKSCSSSEAKLPAGQSWSLIVNYVKAPGDYRDETLYGGLDDRDVLRAISDADTKAALYAADQVLANPNAVAVEPVSAVNAQ